jgi:hypothetical protein
MNQVVIASRLSDGRVVFLSKGAVPGAVVWASSLAEAALADDESRAEELLALSEADMFERHEVLDPYLIDVALENGELRPTKSREAIRCFGPTVTRNAGQSAEGSRP